MTRTSGVFLIKHDDFADFQYCGASTQVEGAFRDYLKQLKRGQAPRSLQDLHDQGASREGFRYQLLEEVPPNRLRARKHAWQHAPAGAPPQRDLPPPSSPVPGTVGVFIREWFALHRQGISLTTERRYRGHIENHILPQLGHIPLEELSVLRVQEFVSHLLEKGFCRSCVPRGLSPKSVRDCVGLLRLALEQALEWGMLSRITQTPVTMITGVWSTTLVGPLCVSPPLFLCTRLGVVFIDTQC